MKRIPISLAFATLAGAAFTCVGFCADAPAPAKYTINFIPPVKEGQKFSFVGDGTHNQVMDMTMTLPNSPTPQSDKEDETAVVHLEADGEVLALFPNGTVQKEALTVKILTATDKGMPVAGLPAAGAKIVVERKDPDNAFSVDDKPLSPDISELLDGVINNLGDPKTTDQDMFGAKEPMAVGSSWPIDSAKTMESMKDAIDGADLSAAKISGSMKLDSATGADADLVLNISGTFTVDGAKLPLPLPIPGGLQTQVKTELTESFPATAKGVCKASMVQTMDGTTSDSGASAGMAMKMTMHTVSKGEYVMTFP